MQLLDQLERDYHIIYPDDPPILEEGFEEALRQIVIPWAKYFESYGF